jgi:hypothetical protein
MAIKVSYTAGFHDTWSPVEVGAAGLVFTTALMVVNALRLYSIRSFMGL